jgi:glycosyltransferase involved in cell wall biosynthesis
MKILILSWRDINNPKAGGSEIYFHEMAKRWVKWGNEVTWICAGWKGCKKKEYIDCVEIRRVGNEMTLYSIAPFVYFLLKKKPDIIIDNENGIPFFSPIYSFRKILLHIHHVHKDVWKKEVMIQGLKGKIIGSIGYILENKIMPFVYRKNKVITLSKSSANEILSEKLTKDKPLIVNPGINFEEYELYPKEKRPTILFLNRIKKYKGLDVFLEAVLKIKETGLKNFEVWVAGSGDDLDRNKKYAQENKLKEVKFFGRISEKKKKELMQKAWIFVNPSFKEGWGIVNIEANYYGTCVVGSDVSGIRDSIIDKKTGLLFPYGDSKILSERLLKLIRNKAMLRSISYNAKKWSKNFDWDKKSEEYFSILEKSVNHR